MVLRAQWPLGTIAQFFHFVAEEKNKKKQKQKQKKKRRQKNKGILWLGYHRYPSKKTKAFYDWATTGVPVKICQALNANSVILARKFNKSKSKFWHHVIALPRKIPKIYLQVFFSFLHFMPGSLCTLFCFTENNSELEQENSNQPRDARK